MNQSITNTKILSIERAIYVALGDVDDDSHRWPTMNLSHLKLAFKNGLSMKVIPSVGQCMDLSFAVVLEHTDHEVDVELFFDACFGKTEREWKDNNYMHLVDCEAFDWTMNNADPAFIKVESDKRHADRHVATYSVGRTNGDTFTPWPHDPMARMMITRCIRYALEMFEVDAIHVHVQGTHNRMRVTLAKRLAEYYPVEYVEHNMDYIGCGGESQCAFRKAKMLPGQESDEYEWDSGIKYMYRYDMLSKTDDSPLEWTACPFCRAKPPTLMRKECIAMGQFDCTHTCDPEHWA